jgi:hypothetical protein
MLLTCSIKCVTGFGIQLFSLGNLRYNHHRVRVYEPCFPGYKAQTPFRRAAPVPFNNLPCNLAPGKTTVYPLIRINVRTTSDSGSHEQSQIVPAFGQPPSYHIRNFQDGIYWYVLRDTSWLMFISLATDRCRHNSHNERKWQATDIHQEEQRLPMSHTGRQLAPSPMRVHNIQHTIQGS